MGKLKVVMVNWTVSEGSIASIMREIERNNRDRMNTVYCYQVGEKSSRNQYRVSSWRITKCYYALARIVGIKYGLGSLLTRKMLCFIRKQKPDIVHIHCPNFYTINLYLMFKKLKQWNIPTVITNHAEFFFTGNCAHAMDCEGYLSGCRHCTRVFDTSHRYLTNHTAYEWGRMRGAFQNAGNFCLTAVSPWAKQRIRNSPITRACKVRLIENAVNTSIFRVRDVARKKQEFLKAHAADGRCKMVLQVTSFFSSRMDDSKGGYYLLKAAEELPDVLFVVAGANRLSERDKAVPNVLFLGNVASQNLLADYYNMADLTVLTSKRETFGMACAESLACGTPVVGFEAGGTESIAIRQYSEFVPFGDVAGLKEAICRFLDLKQGKEESIAKEARHRYSEKRMSEAYMRLYEDMLAERK